MTGRELREFCRALDVDWPCSVEALNHARNIQIQAFHPDRHQHNETLRKAGEEKLKRVNLAYERLKAYVAKGSPQCGACDEPTASPGDLCPACVARVRARRQEERVREETAREHAAREQAARERAAREEAARSADIRGTWRAPGLAFGNARYEITGQGPAFQLEGFGPLGRTDEGVAVVEGARVEIRARNVMFGTYSGSFVVDGNRMSGVMSFWGLPAPVELWRG